jgi:hypothetical protein
MRSPRAAAPCPARRRARTCAPTRAARPGCTASHSSAPAPLPPQCDLPGAAASPQGTLSYRPRMVAMDLSGNLGGEATGQPAAGGLGLRPSRPPLPPLPGSCVRRVQKGPPSCPPAQRSAAVALCPLACAPLWLRRWGARPWSCASSESRKPTPAPQRNAVCSFHSQFPDSPDEPAHLMRLHYGTTAVPGHSGRTTAAAGAAFAAACVWPQASRLGATALSTPMPPSSRPGRAAVRCTARRPCPRARLWRSWRSRSTWGSLQVGA